MMPKVAAVLGAVLLLPFSSVVASAAGTVTSAPTDTATVGTLGIRLVDVPVSSAGDPRARLYIVDHLSPGTVIKRRIEVSNTTRTPLSVALYSAAASIDLQESGRCKPAAGSFDRCVESS